MRFKKDTERKLDQLGMSLQTVLEDIETIRKSVELKDAALNEYMKMLSFLKSINKNLMDRLMSKDFGELQTFTLPDAEEIMRKEIAVESMEALAGEIVEMEK